MNSLEGLVGAWLAEHHATKKWLAGELGCTPETLNRKLCGTSELSVTEARRLAEAMGGDVGILFNSICQFAAENVI
ncbi:hypothetical protein [Olsenella phocaeensis]|uniref:hypothetical protein n=1 Tax=Olsenella phocaeensis TaxID=1852385 RepID=UPI000931B2EC|nr:hypothetical protein [Olsenella phocaeensis]